jgi:hypothetical protein
MRRRTLDPSVRFAAVEVVRDWLDSSWASVLAAQWNADAPEGDGWRTRYTVRESRANGVYIESRRVRG